MPNTHETLNFDSIQPRRPASRIRFHDGIQPTELELDPNQEGNRLTELATWGYRLIYPPSTATGVVCSMLAPGCFGLLLGGAVAAFPFVVGIPVLLLTGCFTFTLRTVYAQSPTTSRLLALRLALFTLPLLLGFTVFYL